MKYLLTILFTALIPFTHADDKDVVALFNLNSAVSEGNQAPGIQELLANDPNPRTFMSLISRIRKAAKDDNVKACVFYGESNMLGMAQTEEIHKHMKMLRDAGKKTYFYARNLTQGSLFTAAEADKIVLFPEGEVMFTGMLMQSMYFKNLLDKLGIQADIIHIGDFKSAGEPFYLTGPSEESKKQTLTLMNTIYSKLTSTVSSGKNISADEIKKLTERALISAKDAKKAGLVDELMYHKDFIDSLKKEFGVNSKIVKNYAVPKKEEIQLNSILDVFALINKLSTPPKKDSMDKISLTVLEGAIDGAMGESLRRHILKMAKDKTVKAMILRINSPGGSAQASEIIHQALIEFKKTGKPLIATMSNVAASGGYYVAAPADLILAESLTITGSIGVVGGKIVLGGMLDKIGISTHEFSKGKHAGLLNPMKPFTEEGKKVLRQAFERVYATFKARVTEGRKGKLKGNLEDLAGGRVYTGSQALEIGLIDQIGGLRDSIKITVDKAKLGKYKITMFPKQVTLETMLAENLRQGGDDDEVIGIGNDKKLTNLLKESTIKSKLSALAEINPSLAKNLHTFLQHLQALSTEGVLLIGPSYNY